MIHYDVGFWHIGFIFRVRGATFLKASVFAIPAAILSGVVRGLVDSEGGVLDKIAIDTYMGQSQAWAALNIVIGLLLAARSQQALSRFWEGLTLVHQMSAEWYDATSSLVAFSHCSKSKDIVAIDEFQHTIVRLMSLMHGSALHQVKEGQNEDFEAIGLADLDVDSLLYLHHCKEYGINRIEILLHWIHELVTQNAGREKVLSVPAPILTRVYQELSRGIVHLNDARKITETPFPFPFAQVIVILLLLDTLLIPVMVAMFVEHPVWSALFTYVCTLSMWSLNLIAGEIEQPFGNDANDLPLAMLQNNLNRSLLVLLDPRAQKAPCLKDSACRDRVSVGKAQNAMQTEGMHTLSLEPQKSLTLDLTDLANDVMKSKQGYLGKVQAVITSISRRVSATFSHSASMSRTMSGLGIAEEATGDGLDSYILGVAAIRGPSRQKPELTQSRDFGPELIGQGPASPNNSDGENSDNSERRRKSIMSSCSSISTSVVEQAVASNGNRPFGTRSRSESLSSSDSLKYTSKNTARHERSMPDVRHHVLDSSLLEDLPSQREMPRPSRSISRLEGDVDESSQSKSARSVPSENFRSQQRGPGKTRQRHATKPRTPTESPTRSPRGKSRRADTDHHTVI